MKSWTVLNCSVLIDLDCVKPQKDNKQMRRKWVNLVENV